MLSVFASFQQLKDQSRKVVRHLASKPKEKSYKKREIWCLQAEKCLTTIAKLRSFLTFNNTNWNHIDLPSFENGTKFHICASFTLHSSKMSNNQRVTKFRFTVHPFFQTLRWCVPIQSFFHKWFVNTEQYAKRVKAFLIEQEEKEHCTIERDLIRHVSNRVHCQKNFCN